MRPTTAHWYILMNKFLRLWVHLVYVVNVSNTTCSQILQRMQVFSSITWQMVLVWAVWWTSWLGTILCLFVFEDVSFVILSKLTTTEDCFWESSRWNSKQRNSHPLPYRLGPDKRIGPTTLCTYSREFSAIVSLAQNCNMVSVRWNFHEQMT